MTEQKGHEQHNGSTRDLPRQEWIEKWWSNAEGDAKEKFELSNTVFSQTMVSMRSSKGRFCSRVDGELNEDGGVAHEQ